MPLYRYLIHEMVLDWLLGLTEDRNAETASEKMAIEKWARRHRRRIQWHVQRTLDEVRKRLEPLADLDASVLVQAGEAEVMVSGDARTKAILESARLKTGASAGARRSTATVAESAPEAGGPRAAAPSDQRKETSGA